MEPGGKGSFQAVKLQRFARTTVCSHSPEGHGRQSSIYSQKHFRECAGERLPHSGQSGSGVKDEYTRRWQSWKVWSLRIGTIWGRKWKAGAGHSSVCRRSPRAHSERRRDSLPSV